MKRYFTYKDEKSDKFWSIDVQGVLVTVLFGKTGTAYEEKTGKDYATFLTLIPSTPYPELVIDWQEENDSLKIKFPKLWKKYFEV